MSRDMKGERYLPPRHLRFVTLGIARDVDVDVKDEEGEEETKISEEEDDDETETKDDASDTVTSHLNTTKSTSSSSRSACLELIASLGQYVKDEIVLQRLVPYVSL